MPKMLSHLFLKNQQGSSHKFDMSRKIDDDNVATKPAEAYRAQKDRLHTCYQTFDRARRERLNQRTLDVPAHIAYVEIHFYIIFGDNPPFRTKTTFENKFGLSPVMYSNFNNSVL